MRLDRLEALLDDWTHWMTVDNHGLGYPSKSTMLLSGGESSNDVFEHMIEESDNRNIRIVDACIDSLPDAQKKAVYAQHLKLKKTMFHERDYSLALDNLLTIVGRRIYA
jgi:hypothetical protein